MGKKRKKKRFLSLFNVFATPPPTGAASNRQTQPGSQTCICLSKKKKKSSQSGERSRGHAWDCRSTRALAYTHTHSKISHSFTPHTPLNFPVYRSHSQYPHLSFWTPGVLPGFHPCSALFSFHTIFTHSSIGSGAASDKHGEGTKCVCVWWG